MTITADDAVGCAFARPTESATMTSHCESVVLLGGSLPNKGQKAIERAYRRLPEEWRAYKKKHPLLLQAIDAILGYSETARSRALKHGSLGDLTPNIPADLCYLGRFPDSKLQEIKKAIS